MLEIKAKLKTRAAAYGVKVHGRLELPFESRRTSRLRTKLASGEEVGLMLPQGEVLRGGDLVTASDGRVIAVVAQAEKLLHVEAATAQLLAKVAYHLGSRHVPVEVGDGYLRLADDGVLEQALLKLGAKVSRIEAPFEPEASADDHHGHDHDHDHDHGCSHDHGHGHGHAHPHRR